MTATQTRKPPQKCSGHGAPMLADEEKTVEGFAQKLYCAVDPKTGARFERTLDGATGLSSTAM